MSEILPIECVVIYRDRVVVMLSHGPEPEGSKVAASLLEAYAWARKRLEDQAQLARGRLS